MQEGICENLFFVFHELKVLYQERPQTHEIHYFFFHIPSVPFCLVQPPQKQRFLKVLEALRHLPRTGNQREALR